MRSGLAGVTKTTSCANCVASVDVAAVGGDATSDVPDEVASGLYAAIGDSSGTTADVIGD